MRSTLGETRSSVQRTHALICNDSHEAITLPHWPGTQIVSFISPAIGAGFSFFRVTTSLKTQIPPPRHGGIRFVLVRAGRAQVSSGADIHTLAKDAFVYLPGGSDCGIELEADTELLCLEKRYQPEPGESQPSLFVSSIGDTTKVALRGDDFLHVRKLLPENPGFDMEINVMEFAPGAALPYVETHFMEHGLMMLDGGGIYRLDERWYPVSAGDAIWMAPYCPQWFGALGRRTARYLIYKNWNRDPLR